MPISITTEGSSLKNYIIPDENWSVTATHLKNWLPTPSLEKITTVTLKQWCCHVALKDWIRNAFSFWARMRKPKKKWTRKMRWYGVPWGPQVIRPVAMQSSLFSLFHYACLKFFSLSLEIWRMREIWYESSFVSDWRIIVYNNWQGTCSTRLPTQWPCSSSLLISITSKGLV